MKLYAFLVKFASGDEFIGIVAGPTPENAMIEAETAWGTSSTLTFLDDHEVWQKTKKGFPVSFTN
jgi:hypothetical protein